MRLKKRLRSLVAHPFMQDGFSLLHRIALAGMNYGGAASTASAGDRVALDRLADEPSRELVVLDVGANTGGYVSLVREVLGPQPTVVAFEPSAEAFTALERAHGTQSRTHLVRAGVGETAGRAALFSPRPGSVLASLYADGAADAQDIEVITLDGYCAEHRIERIDLLKLDVEGGELAALRGARRLRDEHRIRMIQFEFGQPSLRARTYLADLFSVLSNDFELYRVLPSGLRRLRAYHESLEVFMSTNYLAIAKRDANGR